MWEVVTVASTICTSFYYRCTNSMNICVLMFWCMITSKMVIFDSLAIYINVIEDAMHKWTHKDITSLNLTHYFLGQIWNFSSSFVSQIVLPVMQSTIDFLMLTSDVRSLPCSMFYITYSVHTVGRMQCIKTPKLAHVLCTLVK